MLVWLGDLYVFAHLSRRGTSPEHHSLADRAFQVNSKDVIRPDSSRVILIKNPTWKSELLGLYTTLRIEPYVLLLFPMFFTSVRAALVLATCPLADIVLPELVLYLPIQFCQRRSLRRQNSRAKQHSILSKPDRRRWHIRVLSGHQGRQKGDSSAICLGGTFLAHNGMCILALQSIVL